MKLRVNRQELATALSAVSSVVASRTPKPVLQCVRVDARPDHLLLSCTDLEVGLRYSVTQVEVEQPGEMLLRAETLAKITRESADEILLMEGTDRLLHIRGADSHFQIIASELEEFPSVPEMKGEPQFRIQTDSLRRLSEWTLFACARESTRYAINGVLFVVKDRLLAIATDGRRLSKGAAEIDRLSDADIPSVIVPTKALALVKGFAGEGDEPIGIQIAENQMILRVAQATVSTALIEGHFPKYEDVIPRDNDRRAELETVGFLSALRQAALLTNEESKGVRLSFTADRLVLSSRAPEQGEAEIAMPVKFTGEPVDIGFNPHFLIEALKIARNERVVFRCSTPQRPGLLELDEDFIYVIMPVTLS